MTIEVEYPQTPAISWTLPHEQLSYKDSWIDMMLKHDRIEECTLEDLMHVVPRFPVTGKEKSGFNRVVGSFQKLP